MHKKEPHETSQGIRIRGFREASRQWLPGSTAIQNLAAKFGIQPEDLSGKLAELLPGAIDRMTPDGTLPNGEG